MLTSACKKHGKWKRKKEKRSRPISRVLSWVTIPLGPLSPAASSSLPGSHARTTRCRLLCDFPIWPCSRWGLPCQPCYHVCGALLPHHFTLACDPSRRGSLRIGGIFLLHFPWARAPQALPGTVSEGARTFLHDDLKRHRSDHLADSEATRYRPRAPTTIAKTRWYLGIVRRPRAQSFRPSAQIFELHGACIGRGTRYAAHSSADGCGFGGG